MRLLYIDHLRGFAILLVILGHIYITKAPGNGHYAYADIIYSFHMSLFFFISGFLAFRTNQIKEKGKTQYIIKKTQTLLLPYLFWLFVSPVFMNNYIPTTLEEICDKLNFVPNLNYWFLPLLFIFNILYAVYISFAKFNKYLETGGVKKEVLILIILFVGLFCTGLLIKQYYFAVYSIYFISFMFGHIISKHKYIERFILRNNIFAFSTIILCFLWKVFPLNTDGNKWFSLLNLCYLTSASSFAIISLYNIFYKINLHKYISRYLSEIGKYTMALYLFPLWPFTKDFHWDDSYTNTLINLQALGIAIIHSLVALAIAKVIEIIPIVRTLLMGKK